MDGSRFFIVFFSFIISSVKREGICGDTPLPAFEKGVIMHMAATIAQQPGRSERIAEADRSSKTEGFYDGEVYELTGSHILCRALIREGVKLLYGYPGGAIMPFYDALTDYPALHHVLVRH